MLKNISVISAVTLMPVVLLFNAAVHGGFWVIPPLLFLGAIGHICDELLENRPDALVEQQLQNALPICLALLHFPLLGSAIWSLTNQPFTLWEKLALFGGFALYFAHVSNAVGHELIHRRTRLQFTLGKWLFISVLFGHHTSSHRLVHHRYVATRHDPNTARYGESFYRFFLRAWRGSFLAGLSAENERLGYDASSRRLGLAHPYLAYILGSFACLIAIAGGAGRTALFVYLLLAFLTQAGLLMTDYTQHYGLTRAKGKDGKFPPVAPHHSWNAPHWFTRNLTLNAPLHSDHHAKPAKPYAELQTYGDNAAPQLPYGPGIMAFIALHPKRWRRVMHPRIDQWALHH